MNLQIARRDLLIDVGCLARVIQRIIITHRRNAETRNDGLYKIHMWYTSSISIIQIEGEGRLQRYHASSGSATNRDM